MTGIPKWPRAPEQTTTSYRCGPFLCPWCGKNMLLKVPGFDLDVIPEEEIGLYLSCSDFDCGRRILITAAVNSITEKTARQVGTTTESGSAECMFRKHDESHNGG